MTKSKEADIGNGWFAKLHCDEDGIEALYLRNDDTGRFINLPDDSVKRLRKIFETVDGMAAA